MPVAKIPRPSAVYGVGGNGYQPFALPGGNSGRQEKSNQDDSGNLGLGLTEKDINDRACSVYF